ncbi:MAG: hypothetical protein U0169_12640 [Polyangiaceae bacterium]
MTGKTQRPNATSARTASRPGHGHGGTERLDTAGVRSQSGSETASVAAVSAALVANAFSFANFRKNGASSAPTDRHTRNTKSTTPKA